MKRVLESMLAGGVLGAIVFTFLIYIGLNLLKLPWGNFGSFLSGAIVMACNPSRLRCQAGEGCIDDSAAVGYPPGVAHPRPI